MSEAVFSNIEEFVRAPRLTGLGASRSGMVVVSGRSIDEDGASFIDQLFEVSLDGARQLTHGAKSASLLAIGERGEVYFSRSDPGAEKKGDAIWMLPPAGEAREIFRYRGEISAVSVSNTSLLLTLNVLPEAADGGNHASEMLEKSAALSKRREDTKTTAVLHERYPTRYWSSDLGPGEARLFVSALPPLDTPVDATMWHATGSGGGEGGGEGAPTSTTFAELKLSEVVLPKRPDGVDQWHLESSDLAPDGSFALATMAARTGIDTFTQVWKLDLLGNTEPALLQAEDHADVSCAAIAPDSSWVALTKELPPLPGQTVAEETFKVEVGSGRRLFLTDAPWTSFVISPSQAVYVTADRMGRGGIFRLDEDGNQSLLTPDDEYTYSSLNWAAGALVALRSSVAEPPELVYINPDSGEVTEGMRLIPSLDLPGVLTEVTATALDGTPLRSWLVLPEHSGPYPLVVFAHGGPWGSWNDWTWRWNPWVFAARGYAVLLPDPGISTGYGFQMLSRGHDAIGDQPFTDIMALTDAALERPDVDASRQLFAGGSYGGYVANWVAGHTGGRSNGIVTHASLWNTESMARIADNGAWYRWMMTPAESSSTDSSEGVSQADLWSPHRFAEEIEVPMLVIHGDKDYRVPISQGQELWFDLQRTSPHLGHQFLYYPDEGHRILKPGNAEVWYETFLDFLDRHRDGK